MDPVIVYTQIWQKNYKRGSGKYIPNRINYQYIVIFRQHVGKKKASNVGGQTISKIKHQKVRKTCVIGDINFSVK
jgi:hypothetical protein